MLNETRNSRRPDRVSSPNTMWTAGNRIGRHFARFPQRFQVVPDFVSKISSFFERVLTVLQFETFFLTYLDSIFFFQNDDYISIRLGAAMLNDDTIGSLLVGKPPVALPVIDSSPLSSKIVNEQQMPGYPEHLAPRPGFWQPVTGTRYKFFVFSAFLDNRKGQKTVRVVGATKTRGPERVYCRFWYRLYETNATRHISKTVPAKIKVRPWFGLFLVLICCVFRWLERTGTWNTAPVSFCVR